jgi:hypothetical protein
MKLNFARSSFVLTIAAFATLLFPAVVTAQSCDAFASNIVSQFGSIPPGQGTMDVRLVSNRSDGTQVTYAEKPSGTGATNPACLAAGTCLSGGLSYYPGRHFGLLYFPPSLSGTLTQFFSDRRFGTPAGSLLGLPSYPFKPYLIPSPPGTDELGLTIYLGNSILGYTTGEVVYTSKSEGNGSFRGLCQDGMLYGFEGDTTMYVLSLYNLKLNQPPPIQ